MIRKEGDEIERTYNVEEKQIEAKVNVEFVEKRR